MPDLGLYCLSMTLKRDARLIWVNPVARNKSLSHEALKNKINHIFLVLVGNDLRSRVVYDLQRL